MVERSSISRKVFIAFNFLFCIVLMAMVLFPYLNILAKALNEGADTAKGGIYILPRKITWANFEIVLTDKGFMHAFLLTASVLVIGTIVGLLVQFMAAYAMLNQKLVGHRFLSIMFIIPMYFGGGLIPQYVLYSQLGLLNNYWVYILPTCFAFYNMIIIRSFLQTIPESLAESAKIDGANDITIAFKIIMPLSKPVLATVGLWIAIGKWNDSATTLYYITKKKLFSLQYVLLQVLKEAAKVREMMLEMLKNGSQDIDMSSLVTSEAVKSAQIIVTTLPVVIAYPFLQKYFISGVTLGAVKD